MSWLKRWTVLVYVVGFWAGFWISGSQWAPWQLVEFGAITGLGFLLVALAAVHEREGRQ